VDDKRYIFIVNEHHSMTMQIRSFQIKITTWNVLDHLTNEPQSQASIFIEISLLLILDSSFNVSLQRPVYKQIMLSSSIMYWPHKIEICVTVVLLKCSTYPPRTIKHEKKISQNILPMPLLPFNSRNQPTSIFIDQSNVVSYRLLYFA
jgi:hypothetical protein